jgi:pimeloyl-ACP methyl ester carboxylesterase
MRRCADGRAYLAIAFLLGASGCVRANEPSSSAISARISASARLADGSDRFFEVDGFRIHYREIGRGEPVVLLHGRASNLEVWNWLADSLAKSYRVIAYDQRGAGLSTKSGDPARYGRSMANDVTGLLEHLGLRRAHVVGHSQGAVIAAYVAAHHPDRVATVALIAGPYSADSASYASSSAATVRDLEAGLGMLNFYRQRGLSDSLATAVNSEMMARNDAASLAATVRALGGLMMSSGVGPTIRVPLVVVVGTRDALLQPNRRFASWTGARLVEVPEATHVSILQHPQVVSTLRMHIQSAANRN